MFSLLVSEEGQADQRNVIRYPAKIKEHHHTTLAYLPTDIALALSQDPTLVIEAAKAFYEREPATLKVGLGFELSLRCCWALGLVVLRPEGNECAPSRADFPLLPQFCNTMTRFPPSSPSTALSPTTSSTSLPSTVLTPILLTRPLYSLLLLQRFFPPKPFLSASWDKAALDEEDERRREMGMKLACGFEMRWGVTKGVVEREGAKGDEAGWKGFVEQLRAKGYFGEEVVGSERWVELERLAKKGWEEARMAASEGDR